MGNDDTNAQAGDLPAMVKLTPNFAAGPQPGAEAMQALADAGFKSVICNRPDAEVAPGERAADMEAAARAAGLEFAVIEVVHAPITPDMIAAQKHAMTDLPGPHFAYCRAGFRSSVIWALASAGTRPTDEIVDALTKAGFAMPGLRAQIDRLAAAG
ncbi:Sulfide-quinone reductase [Rhodovulum sp. P5]|uniref:TIGR01244 family sulfur transferase n=1 Tax=Rhodovulum sp. P5 TaxID=1564506 RepID=UPI0009C2558C|nr:TIGR01244 family sulfur transferase [Rhodovulum sp. P5]ARE38362.1 Sulfide-quinone reductase [Rhodovulum sp. P5]